MSPRPGQSTREPGAIARLKGWLCSGALTLATGTLALAAAGTPADPATKPAISGPTAPPATAMQALRAEAAAELERTVGAALQDHFVATGGPAPEALSIAADVTLASDDPMSPPRIIAATVKVELTTDQPPNALREARAALLRHLARKGWREGAPPVMASDSQSDDAEIPRIQLTVDATAPAKGFAWRDDWRAALIVAAIGSACVFCLLVCFWMLWRSARVFAGRRPDTFVAEHLGPRTVAVPRLFADPELGLPEPRMRPAAPPPPPPQKPATDASGRITVAAPTDGLTAPPPAVPPPPAIAAPDPEFVARITALTLPQAIRELAKLPADERARVLRTLPLLEPVRRRLEIELGLPPG